MGKRCPKSSHLFLSLPRVNYILQLPISNLLNKLWLANKGNGCQAGLEFLLWLDFVLLLKRRKLNGSLLSLLSIGIRRSK